MYKAITDPHPYPWPAGGREPSRHGDMEYRPSTLLPRMLGGREKADFRLAVCIVAILCNADYTRAEGTWTDFDVPGSWATTISGITGNNVFGNYRDDHGNTSHGFLYDGITWTTFDAPGAASTFVCGISGNNLIGTYNYEGHLHGFIYDGISYITLDKPGVTDTYIRGIDGSNLFGYYYSGTGPEHGFLYDTAMSTWTILDKPGSSATKIHDIDGLNVVGWASGANGGGFLYDGVAWTKIAKAGWNSMEVRGISGSNLVGYYQDVSGPHSFLFDSAGESWTTLSNPAGVSWSTSVLGIEGDKVFGSYTSASDYGYHGFIYTIPEPAQIALLGLGFFVICKRKALHRM